jgi:hypothetical protein
LMGIWLTEFRTEPSTAQGSAAQPADTSSHTVAAMRQAAKLPVLQVPRNTIRITLPSPNGHAACQ